MPVPVAPSTASPVTPAAGGASPASVSSTPSGPTVRPTAGRAVAAVKKAKRQVPSGRAYVHATYNNTIVTFTDPQGNVLAQASAGRVGFRGPKKSTPYAAGLIVKQAAARVQPYGLREVNVFVKGFGSGREAAIRAINANGIVILGIKDVSPLPHNGCRPKKPRRI